MFSQETWNTSRKKITMHPKHLFTSYLHQSTALLPNSCFFLNDVGACVQLTKNMERNIKEQKYNTAPTVDPQVCGLSAPFAIDSSHGASSQQASMMLCQSSPVADLLQRDDVNRSFAGWRCFQFVSSKRKRLEERNFIVYAVFPLQHMKRPALQIKCVRVLRMAFRARKVFGIFEKRAPCPKRPSFRIAVFFFE